MFDASHIKVHQHGAGAVGRNQVVGRTSRTIRGRLKSRVLRHTAQHQPAHRNLHPSCAALRQFRIIFAQTPLPTQPAQCPRHCPTPWQHRKTTRPALRGTISRRQPNRSRTHSDNAPRYAPSAQISRRRDILPASFANTAGRRPGLAHPPDAPLPPAAAPPYPPRYDACGPALFCWHRVTARPLFSVVSPIGGR